MKPEEHASQEIDRQLAQCGWVVQDRDAMNISAAQGVAVREFQLATSDADYMLYADGKVIADSVNVAYDAYHIETQITKDGATLPQEPGYFVPRRDRRTRKKRYAELDDDLTYTGAQLDRDVVAEAQIRLVIRTFRERLFTDIFPGRAETPKTLVFAKTDLHADDIVQALRSIAVIREEFGKGSDFCQKITYRTTGKKPEELLNEFRNSYNPRIAVTVDMIATGADVKPLECLLFMRNIRSASYFEQMKGRGSRVIAAADLLQVTPDAVSAFLKYQTRLFRAINQGAEPLSLNTVIARYLTVLLPPPKEQDVVKQMLEAYPPAIEISEEETEKLLYQEDSLSILSVI